MGEMTEAGYLARPEGGDGPGVLVLHAWWGLTPMFTGLCDRLADEGFVALAPDLYGGPTATTIEQAQQLIENFDRAAAITKIEQAVNILRGNTTAEGSKAGVIGFSLGAAFALDASVRYYDLINAVVLFYGTDHGEYTSARAAYQGHFAEQDEWEAGTDIDALEAQLGVAGRDVTFYRYSGTHHWFFEEDRPEYNPRAAELAWRRTVDFLKARLMEPAS
ncbi:MAG TPA: dienelactone hydrolase family protein [Roseiflexaceae bacterium]|nr:dienelactone hydrolase family protein [Roseiflexaceae bacterium]